mmetsp:Transcript_133169/g.315701  ORF Transcript_133169/g.315701 Transcript_133169/m.315701 type:complete len:257 (+) Transcript_133169:42-812(+)
MLHLSDPHLGLSFCPLRQELALRLTPLSDLLELRLVLAPHVVHELHLRLEDLLLVPCSLLEHLNLLLAVLKLSCQRLQLCAPLLALVQGSFQPLDLFLQDPSFGTFLFTAHGCGCRNAGKGLQVLGRCRRLILLPRVCICIGRLLSLVEKEVLQPRLCCCFRAVPAALKKSHKLAVGHVWHHVPRRGTRHVCLPRFGTQRQKPHWCRQVGSAGKEGTRNMQGRHALLITFSSQAGSLRSGGQHLDDLMLLEVSGIV